MALGDYDADGDLDVLMAHWGTPRDPTVIPGETETSGAMIQTPGAMSFTPVSATSGVAGLLAFDLATRRPGARISTTLSRPDLPISTVTAISTF